MFTEGNHDTAIFHYFCFLLNFALYVGKIVIDGMCAILMKIASKSKHQLVKREAVSYSLEQVQTGFRILVRDHVWRTGIDFRCECHSICITDPRR